MKKWQFDFYDWYNTWVPKAAKRWEFPAHRSSGTHGSTTTNEKQISLINQPTNEWMKIEQDKPVLPVCLQLVPKPLSQLV